MMMKRREDEGAVIDRVMGRIRSSAISRSNMRNRIATRKKRKEKGSRGDFIGSNPHS